MKKHIIWQNYDFNLEDWKDFLDEEYPEVIDENKQYDLISDLNDECLDDERMNLSIEASGDIIAIADIGLWNGRKKGYRELNSDNVSDCLQFEKDCDYAEWYVDQYGNLKSSQSHHDGTHYIIYRAWKNGVTDEQKDRVLNGLYYGTISDRTIRRYTESLGKYVANVYGWKISGKF